MKLFTSWFYYFFTDKKLQDSDIDSKKRIEEFKNYLWENYADEEIISPTVVLKSEEYFNDAPYSFKVMVTCDESDEEPSILSFEPNTPTVKCNYICPHCETIITFKALDHRNQNVSKRYVSFSEREHKKAWWDDSIFSRDITGHDIMTIEACTKDLNSA